MSKELEALERLKTAPSFMGGTVEYQACTKSETLLMQDYETVKQALQRLESIDNAEPSEALETVDFLLSVIKVKDIIEPDFFWKYVKTIKQALIKAEKEHKTLETIKEKCVDVFRINYYITSNRISELEEYKRDRKLTDEELELLKEVLE